LQHVAHHFLANRLFARAQGLDHRLLVHPLSDLGITVSGRRIPLEGPEHNLGLLRIDVQPSRTIGRTLHHRHQIVAKRRHTAVELPIHRALALGAFGFRAQVA